MPAVQRAKHLRVQRPYHIMIKAVGPICNLACEYCYYLEKTALYPEEKTFRMDLAFLEEFIRNYIRSHPGPTVFFPWHGGEPTLLGLDFYKQAVAFQKKYLPPGWKCINVPQTNGTLLTAEWCEFFRENNFAIGISIDGPASLHDPYRFDKRGRGSHKDAMRGLRLLQEHHVVYTVLCTVNNINVLKPLQVYRFFREHKVSALQFLPIANSVGNGQASPQSVDSAAYGRFLVAIFDEWLRKDVVRVWVQIIDECWLAVQGKENTLCLYRETCGDSLVMEHNGDLFCCDHYLLEEYKPGNVREKSFKSLVDSPRMKKFAQAKKDSLPAWCHSCEVKFMCNGGCPKDRFIDAPDGEPGLNYLCEGLRHFFSHVRPRLENLDRALRSARRGAPPRQRKAAATGGASPARNAPCPCGSGRKFKQCCMK
ncbi:MAG: anaerobic sulfatase maturase [SAR324 cluster bacterium]|nr:anaerobic sulfatase maturase [SAR324 cluster bacterium]